MKENLQAIINRRFSRRSFLKGLGITSAIGLLPRIAKAVEEKPNDYQVLISWGDPLFSTAEPFNPRFQKLEQQLQAFGYNNDFTAYIPLNNSNTNGLLCVNHEYSIAELMFPNSPKKEQVSEKQVEIEMASVGHSIFEIEKKGEKWQVKKDSKYNRRINAYDTKIDFSGYAAGSTRLKTSYDKTGKKGIGTFGNCSGGKTPWGTILIAEENFDDFFEGNDENLLEFKNYTNYGIGKKSSRYAWSQYVARFNLQKERNEANKYGYIIEINPLDPNSTPIKRTSLGRFKHEAATITISKDSKVVVYMGDDEENEYLYRFVADGIYDPLKPAKNILDKGTLFVAKFFDNGSLEWLPLKYGQNGLDEKNGFFSQADVLIEARRAGDTVGATELDRPEDVETNPITGKTYLALTNNKERQKKLPASLSALPNKLGHIVEISYPSGNHSDKIAQWNIFLVGSDELANPDNFAFNNKGEMFVATDGMEKTVGKPDGLFKIDGKIAYRLYSAPTGAEVCGPEFTPNGENLFIAVQHPGEGSTYQKPSSRFPDFKSDMPPRPSVIVLNS